MTGTKSRSKNSKQDMEKKIGRYGCNSWRGIRNGQQMKGKLISAATLSFPAYLKKNLLSPCCMWLLYFSIEKAGRSANILAIYRVGYPREIALASLVLKSSDRFTRFTWKLLCLQHSILQVGPTLKHMHSTQKTACTTP